MSDLERNVFNVLQRHPFCSAILVAYKLELPIAKVQGVMDELAERGILISRRSS
jgi:hypothetical protein